MHPLAPASPARRRAARRLALAAVLVGLPWPALPAAPAVPQARLRRVFDAFCDTLVPADALTPAASALGVPQTIIDDVGDDAAMQRLVSVACAWLDEQAGGDFAARDVDAREAIAQRMAELPWNTPPRRFFHLLRNTVLAEYYAQPVAWKGLALDRPPQPLGFFDAVPP
jgi:hypothetical protein